MFRIAANLVFSIGVASCAAPERPQPLVVPVYEPNHSKAQQIAPQVREGLKDIKSKVDRLRRKIEKQDEKDQ